MTSWLCTASPIKKQVWKCQNFCLPSSQGDQTSPNEEKFKWCPSWNGSKQSALQSGHVMSQHWVSAYDHILRLLHTKRERKGYCSCLLVMLSISAASHYTWHITELYQAPRFCCPLSLSSNLPSNKGSKIFLEAKMMKKDSMIPSVNISLTMGRAF